MGAHENWVTYWQKGNRIAIAICNGHEFPASSLLLKERIINYAYIITPLGKRIKVKTKAAGNKRIVSYSAPVKGTYIVITALKNPPRYFMKTLFTVGTATHNLIAGEDLELITRRNPHNLKKGERAIITLNYKGKAVSGDLSVLTPGGKRISSFTNSKGQFVLPLRRGGIYLVSGFYRGKGCTLVFRIK